METPFQVLREASHLASPITDQDWALCETGLRQKSLKKSAYFVVEGNMYREIGFVVKGLLRAYYVVDGEEMNCAFYSEGQWAKVYHSFLTQTPSKLWQCELCIF